MVARMTRVAREARASSAASQSRLNLRIARREQELAEKQIKRAIARSIQSFAISTMNSLSKAGPAWSGEFSASWRFVPEGGNGGGPGQPGEIYRYTKNDVRIYDLDRYLKNGITKFQIINTSEHANEAIDAVSGRFTRPDEEPIGDVELGQERDNPSLRYEIGDPEAGTLKEASASRTAEPDWYYTYLQGGGFQDDLSKSFEKEFSINFKTLF